jgi:hypothetical protein
MWQAQQNLSQHQVRVRSPTKRAQSVTLLTCIWLEVRSRHSQSSLRFIFLNPSAQLPGLYLEIKQQTSCYMLIPIRYTLTTQTFDATLRKASLIKPKKNSGASARQRTIPTERPPLVGEVNANFSGRRVSRGQRNKSPQPLISVF